MNIKPAMRRELAQRCAIGPDYLYQVLTGRKVPSPQLCVLLERESFGLIKRQDICPDWAAIWPELANAQPKRKAASKAAQVDNGTTAAA